MVSAREQKAAGSDDSGSLGIDSTSLVNHRPGPLIQPLAKAIARMTKGVDMPNIMMYGNGVIMGFSPFLSPAVCQYLHVLNKFAQIFLLY